MVEIAISLDLDRMGLCSACNLGIGCLLRSVCLSVRIFRVNTVSGLDLTNSYSRSLVRAFACTSMDIEDTFQTDRILLSVGPNVR